MGKVESRKYQVADRKEILKNLVSWMGEQTNSFFLTSYKSRVIGVFVQYEVPDRSNDSYIVAIDQTTEDALGFVSGWLNAVFPKETLFKIEERAKIGFSVYIAGIQSEEQELEVSEDDLVPEKTQDTEKKDLMLQESEQRSLDQIVIAAVTPAISRSMQNNLVRQEETVDGIKRSNLPTPKIRRQLPELESEKPQFKASEKKMPGRKAEYNWEKLPQLYKKHEGSITKIAKELGCSGAAVRRQVAKSKLD